MWLLFQSFLYKKPVDFYMFKDVSKNSHNLLTTKLPSYRDLQIN